MRQDVDVSGDDWAVVELEVGVDVSVEGPTVTEEVTAEVDAGTPTSVVALGTTLTLDVPVTVSLVALAGVDATVDDAACGCNGCWFS